MIIAVTGHRPDKLGGYSPKARALLTQFAVQIIHDMQPCRVITGMALGWDQAIANAAFSYGVPFSAYIPFNGQEARWNNEDKYLYCATLLDAEEVVECSPPGYAVWKMQKRNEDMVKAADTVVALWNGSDGGTANCVRFANKIGKPVINVWDKWEQFKEEYERQE